MSSTTRPDVVPVKSWSGKGSKGAWQEDRGSGKRRRSDAAYIGEPAISRLETLQLRRAFLQELADIGGQAIFEELSRATSWRIYPADEDDYVDKDSGLAHGQVDWIDRLFIEDGLNCVAGLELIARSSSGTTEQRDPLFSLFSGISNTLKIIPGLLLERYIGKLDDVDVLDEQIKDEMNRLAKA
ncbi:hypothetical protein B484DRAFT_431979 [Ochromonadaceae sp. CCMP2298]|nr:hypothetical protein B484DRAFT_431979 [Ochromonadaceae sp. CCMP2298]